MSLVDRSTDRQGFHEVLVHLLRQYAALDYVRRERGAPVKLAVWLSVSFTLAAFVCKTDRRPADLV